MRRLLVLGLALVLALTLGTALAQEPEGWDRSSLVFDPPGCQVAMCGLVQARVCNVGDGAMQGASTWELWYSTQGNPRGGEKIVSGTIVPLLSGMCQPLAWATVCEGNHMFRALQRPGHPGAGDTWSETCTVDCPPTAVGLASFGARASDPTGLTPIAVVGLGFLLLGTITITGHHLRRLRR